MKELKYFDEFCAESNLSEVSLSIYGFVLKKISKNDMDEIDFANQTEEEITQFIMNKLDVKAYTIDIIEKRLSAIRKYYSFLYEKHYITDEQLTKINNVCTNKKEFLKLLMEKQRQHSSYPLPSEMERIISRIDSDDELLNNNFYHVVIELIYKGLNDENFESFFNMERSDVHTAEGTITVNTHGEQYNLYIGKNLCRRLLELYNMKSWELWKNDKHDSKRKYVLSSRGEHIFKFNSYVDSTDIKKINRIIIRRIAEINNRYNLENRGIEFKASRIFYSGLFYRIIKSAMEQGLNISSISIPRYTTDESKKCRDILIAEVERVHLHTNITPIKKNLVPVIDTFVEDINKMESNK